MEAEISSESADGRGIWLSNPGGALDVSSRKVASFMLNYPPSRALIQPRVDASPVLPSRLAPKSHIGVCAFTGVQKKYAKGEAILRAVVEEELEDRREIVIAYTLPCNARQLPDALSSRIFSFYYFFFCACASIARA